jgi:hypothetical protein
MRKLDRLEEIGDAPLKEKKDEVTFFNVFSTSFQRLFFTRFIVAVLCMSC